MDEREKKGRKIDEDKLHIPVCVIFGISQGKQNRKTVFCVFKSSFPEKELNQFERGKGKRYESFLKKKELLTAIKLYN